MFYISNRANVILRNCYAHLPFLKQCQTTTGVTLISDTRFNKMCNNHTAPNRSFMSENFQCREEWEERLNVSPIHGLEMHKYYFELERKFTREGIYFPIDVDIFANGLLKADGKQKLIKKDRIDDRLDQMQEMLQRFRHTPQTNFMLPSTSHAVIRGYLEGDGTDKLLKVLEE